MPGAQLGLVIDLYQGNPAAKYWVEALPLTVHNLSVAEWENVLASAGWGDISAECLTLPTQIAEADFKASGYFPSYEIYEAYCAAGSLLLWANKAK